MKGKILIALLALGISSTILANGRVTPHHYQAAEPNYFDGFYLGLGAGVQHQSGDLDNTITDNLSYTATIISTDLTASRTFSTVFPQDLDKGINNNYFSSEAFAGYGQTFNSLFYAGIELYTRYANAKSNADNEISQSFLSDEKFHQSSTYVKTKTSIEISSDWSYGGALKIGYLITPKIMFYVLAGMENTELDVDVRHSLSFNSAHQDTFVGAHTIETFGVKQSGDDSYHYSFDENKWAFVPGAGIEAMVTDKLSLCLQYTYADYSDFSHNNNYVNPALGEPFTFYSTSSNGYISPYNYASQSYTKIDMDRHLFTLRLTYRFNGI